MITTMKLVSIIWCNGTHDGECEHAPHCLVEIQTGCNNEGIEMELCMN